MVDPGLDRARVRLPHLHADGEQPRHLLVWRVDEVEPGRHHAGRHAVERRDDDDRGQVAVLRALIQLRQSRFKVGPLLAAVIAADDGGLHHPFLNMMGTLATAWAEPVTVKSVCASVWFVAVRLFEKLPAKNKFELTGKTLPKSVNPDVPVPVMIPTNQLTWNWFAADVVAVPTDDVAVLDDQPTQYSPRDREVATPKLT